MPDTVAQGDAFADTAGAVASDVVQADSGAILDEDGGLQAPVVSKAAIPVAMPSP